MTATYPAGITNTEDMIDSRDVIERIAELEADDERDEYEAEELAALKAFAEQGEGFADWQYGEVFIRDSYFEDYARELAEDMGAITGDESWPATCIDWERAARELRMDYTPIGFDGVDYWART
jgi:antirestriction protein